MNTLAIGIDLGTSTSEIAVFRHGDPTPIADPGTKNAIIPSLVAMNKRGKLLIGEEARQFVDLPGYGVREFKRAMGSGDTQTLGDKPYRPEELSALILAKLKQNAETALGETITDVVLSVPANFNDAAKQATLNAARLAGLNVLHLVNEPTAAALAFGIRHINDETQIVVFDFGGGTLDVSTLEMMEGVLEVRTSFGDTHLGGADFDAAMTALMLRKFTAQQGEHALSALAEGSLKAVAEKAKIALSEYSSYEIFLPRFADDLDLDIEVTRDEFEAEVAPLLARARQCLTEALKAGKLKPDAIETVLLVGGTTYIPCVRGIVEAFFQKELRSKIDPDLAVALGAATLAGIRTGIIEARDSLVFSDVCPMGIGIGVVSDIGEQQVLTYKALINPNTQIPFSCRYPMRLLTTDQRKVVVDVYQTHLLDDEYPLDLGIARKLIEEIGLSGLINDIPPALDATPHPIIIDFSYDIHGLVKIRAVIPGLRKSMDIDFAASSLRMGEADLQHAQLRVRELLGGLSTHESSTGTPVDAPANAASTSEALSLRLAPLISRAKHLVADYPRRQAEIESSIDALRSALVNGNDAAVNTAADQLTDLLFKILE